MMADEDIGSSHWDDVVSSNPSRFNDLDSNIVNELSNTLSQQSLVNEEDEDVESSKWKEDEGKKGEQDNKEEIEVEEGDTTIDAEPSRVEEDISTQEDHSNNDHQHEHRDTSGLLSSLTVDADKGFISENFKSPKKDESLFNDSKKGLNFGDDDDDDEDHEEKDKDEVNGGDHNNTKSPQQITSPTKLVNRRKNVYKAPRFRRNGMKSQQQGQQSSTSPIKDVLSNDDQGALGPLGLQDDSENKDQDSETPADKLLKAADAPLFEINRTPLSPLKNARTGSQSSDIPSAIPTTSTIEEPSTEIDPQDPQQQLEQQKIKQKQQIEQKPAIKLDISVGDPIKVGDLTSAHIVYSVRTNTDSELLKSPQTVVSRRYRDFRWLYRQLQATHPGRVIPPPPDKQAVGRFNDDFIEARRLALERMLVKISKNPALQTDPDFIMFLQSERFSSEAREREKAAGSSSTFTNTEKDLNTSSNGGSGFLSSIGGAFSFAPKIVEPDEYFKDKKSYIEALDQQFKVFLRNLETIVIQRHDLSLVTEEFANIIATLADLEVSKSSTDLFQEFSTTQLRIKELLDRLSLQDMLTLGSTLDEYQRVIGSIKDTFNQRDKFLIQLAGSESELKKKQASYDKTFKYNRTHTEKIDALKSELSILEQKHNGIKTNFDEISNTIKDELATFEIDKIQDFRNSIEIFLESTIESQKEAVELWETFYDVNLSNVA